MKSFSLRDPAFLAMLSAGGGGGGSLTLSGLVNMWHFEEASSPNVDSVSAVNLDWGSGDARVAGKIGYAYKGSTLAAATPGNFSLASGNYSIAFWFKLPSSPSTAGLVGNTDGSGANGNFETSFDTTYNRVNFQAHYVGGSAIAQKTITIDTNWHLFIGSLDYSTGTLRIRIDNGTAYTNIVGVITPITGTSPLSVGSAWTGSAFTPGLEVIDELAIFNRVITPTEESQIWNSSAGVTLLP